MSELEHYVRSLEDLGALHLRRPYALIAFGGWIDASWAASNAIRYLIRRLAARRIAELDPESFYSFTDTRPRVILHGGAEREIRWRQGRWHAASMGDDAEHDLVLFIAPEPNLRWRTFTSVVLDVLQRLETEAVLTVGAVLAPTHYRARVPIRGWATAEEWRSALRRHGIIRNTYAGPTGIATVLSLGAAERGLPAVVLNASTPTYLGSNANPKTSLGLLRSVAEVCRVSLPLVDLEQTARSFTQQVDEYLAGQPELRAEIERLAQAAEEEAAPRAPDPTPREGANVTELPASEDVVRELEDFLKSLREAQDDSPGDA